MDFNTALACVLFTTLAACYGWGMRGAVIGGEKGAMLPGAFVGLALAWFSGGAIRDCFWIPAAAGLMGMTFGGIEPYGETIGMVLHRGRPDHNPVKGYTGLAFKGALWFSVCGAFLGISFASMSGVYKVYELVIFCLLIPVINETGYRIFNTPYDKNNKRYPKIFFSLTRREEWGSNVALITALLVFAAVKKDVLTLVLAASGFAFGAIGWVVGMKCFELSSLPFKNGRYLFGKLARRGVIDGWKFMEYVLGAFGGFGLSLAFCTHFGYIEKYNAMIKENGRFEPDGFAKYLPAIACVCVFAVFVINVYQFICDKKGKKLDWFVWDRIERPFYNTLPMLIVLLGSVTAAKIMTVFMLAFVCTSKCVLDRFEKSKLLPIGQVFSLIVCAVVLLGCFTEMYSPFILVVSGIIPYMLAEFIWAVWDNKQNGKNFAHLLAKTAFATVYTCFTVQSALILYISYKFFGF